MSESGEGSESEDSHLASTSTTLLVSEAIVSQPCVLNSDCTVAALPLHVNMQIS